MNMQIEIEKICRTCLGLSGPLLSIYDGRDATTFSIADMLSKFAKIKPKQHDNMPEKVCLSCISEINHCYSFMLKCENSNRTLRQLLPNALLEEDGTATNEISAKPEIAEKSVQTMPQTGKSQYVQTETQAPAAKSNTALQATSANSSTLTINKRRSTHKDEQTLLLYKAIGNEVSSSNDIILEIEEESNDVVEEEFLVNNEESEDKEKENEEEAYYEIPTECYDENYTTLDNNEEDIIDLKDVKFTIYNSADGEAQIVVKHGTNSRRQSRDKVELQCTHCIATFVSAKNLERHMLKRHKVPQETEATNTDEESDSMSQELEKIMEKRTAENSIDENEAKVICLFHI